MQPLSELSFSKFMISQQEMHNVVFHFFQFLPGFFFSLPFSSNSLRHPLLFCLVFLFSTSDMQQASCCRSNATADNLQKGEMMRGGRHNLVSLPKDLLKGYEDAHMRLLTSCLVHSLIPHIDWVLLDTEHFDSIR